MSLELTTLKFSVETQELDDAISKFGTLTSAVEKLNDANKATKAVNSASAAATKELADANKDLAKSTDTVSEKLSGSEKLLEKLKNQYGDLVAGFSKGEASILQQARNYGVLDASLEPFKNQLKLIKELTKDPFDASIGAIRSVEAELDKLSQRGTLAAQGIALTNKQLDEYSRLASEVKGKVIQMGIDPASAEGQAKYNTMLKETQADYLMIAQAVSALAQVEKARNNNLREAEKIQAAINRENMTLMDDAVSQFRKAEQSKVDAVERTAEKICNANLSAIESAERLEKITARMQAGMSKGEATKRVDLEGAGVAASEVDRLIAAEKNLADVQKLLNPTVERTNAGLTEQAKAAAFLERELARAENAVADFNSSMKVSMSNKLFRYSEELKKAGLNPEEATALMDKYRAALIAGQAKTNQHMRSDMDAQLRNLSRAVSTQMGDVAVSLAGGMNPFTVMLQQGDQLRFAFNQVDASAEQVKQSMVTAAGMIAKSFMDTGKAIGGFFVGAIQSAGRAVVQLGADLLLPTKTLQQLRNELIANNGFSTAATQVQIFDGLLAALTVTAGLLVGALIAVGGALAIAFYQVSKEQDEMNKALIQTGATLGVLGASANDFAKSFENKNVSFGKATELLTEFAKAGSFTKAELEQLIPVAAKMQEAFGQTAQEVVAQFAKVKKDPIDALEELAKATGLVNQDTMNWIRTQKESGDTALATAAAVNEAARVHRETTEMMKTQYSGLGIIMNDVSKGFSAFWGMVKGVVAPKSQLEAMAAAIERTKRIMSESTGMSAETQAKQAAGLKAQQSEYDKLYAAQEKTNKARSEGSEQAKISERLFAESNQYMSQELKLRKEIAQVEKDIAASTNDKAKLAGVTALVELNRKLNEELKKGKTIEGYKSPKDNDLENTKKLYADQLSAAAAFGKDELKINEMQFKLGLKSKAEYTTEQIRLVEASEQKQLDIANTFSDEIVKLQKNQLAEIEKARTTALKNKPKDSEHINDAAQADVKKVQDAYAVLGQIVTTTKEKIKSAADARTMASMEELGKSVSAAKLAYDDYNRSLEVAAEKRQMEIALEQSLTGVVGAEADAIRAKTKALEDSLPVIAKLKQELANAEAISNGVSNSKPGSPEAIAAAKAVENIKTELANTRINAVKASEQSAIDAVTLYYTKAWNDIIAMTSKKSPMDIIKDSMKDLDFGASFEKSADRFAAVLRNAGDTSFANVISSLGQMSKAFEDMADRQDAFAKARKVYANDEKKIALLNDAEQRSDIKSYADLSGAAKKFFKEGSAGYKVLHAAEKAFRAYELAMSIKNTVEKLFGITAVTTASVVGDQTMAASAVVGASTEIAAVESVNAVKAVGAVINQGNGDPYTAFARIAAMAAIMAAIGYAVSGGSSGTPPPASNQGTGTVFGDSGQVNSNGVHIQGTGAKSKSIENSLKLLTEVDSWTMRNTADMLESLRSIDRQMSGVTNVLLRDGTLTAQASSANTGTSGVSNNGKITGISSASIDGALKGLVIGGPIGAIIGAVIATFTKIKTSITGQGIYTKDTTAGQIEQGQSVNSGYYTNVQAKKSFLGINLGSNYSTINTADDQMSKQFTMILQGFIDTVKLAGKPLGVALDSIDANLQNFVISLGNIDIQGLTGEQIQEKLAAVFGAAGDKIAQAAIPGLDKFQKVGEGYFETLVRVATTVETVTSLFDSLGFTLASLNVDRSMKLVDLFGDLDTLSSSLKTYYDDFYSEAEKTSTATRQMTKVLGDMGIAMPTTRLEYRAEVEKALAAGNDELLATLLKLAPAIASIIPVAEDTSRTAADIAASIADMQSQLKELNVDLLNAQGRTQEAAAAFKALSTEGMTPAEIAVWDAIQAMKAQIATTNALAQAEAKRASERVSLEGKLLELQGNTAAIRERELATLDPANQELQKLIYSMQDATTAASALAAAESKRASEAYGIETRILTLQGNTAALRERELALLDPANRANQQLVYNLEDAAAAATAAANASAALAQADAARASEAYGLETQYLQVTGNTVKLRERELALLDEANRPMQLMIWAYEDAQKAQEEATAAQDAANQAAEQAAQAAQALKEAWKSITDTIFEEVARIRGLTGTPENSLAQAQRNFNDATAKARGGDQEAAKMLPDLSKILLDLAAQNATSLIELRRLQSLTANSLENTATGINNQYGIQIPAYASGGSYSGGLALVGETGPELINFGSSGQVYNSNQTASMLGSSNLESLVEKLNENLEALRYEVRADVTHNAKTAKLLDRVIRDGENVSVKFETPQQVTVV